MQAAAFYDEVYRDDVVLCNGVQQNLNRGVYVDGPLHSKRESAVIHLKKLISKDLQAHMEEETRQGPRSGLRSLFTTTTMTNEPRPGKESRLREKKRKTRAAQAIKNGDSPPPPPLPPSSSVAAGVSPDLTRSERITATNHVRRITRKQLNDLETKTNAETTAMNHHIEKATRENRDWRHRVEMANASFRQTQQESMRCTERNVQNIARGHNQLREHVLREGRQASTRAEIIETKMELAAEDVDELREENQALRAKNDELEVRLSYLEDLLKKK
ncbi:hypothetical protein CkaCkLH20_05239 [Colletotrichum karsti]|uniref:Uncharacterized protein n=1 Tax=Colletotrichum karsti TaxID=1095194 RepID=A0A9P6I7T5_9PEZI|nr:uncharacterized protein CkaCkLH20_05239 [Colletotrichum karsti]KAF9877539.1 hypothetical protein CkaCkLH20_05239 [Colletotrichum karsti]